MEIKGKYFLLNNQIKDAGEFSEDFLQRGKNIYEVVRLIEGIPLFLEDHIRRLQRSAGKAGLKLNVSLTSISGRLKNLIEAAEISEGNIKFIYHFEGGERAPFFIAYPIGHSYPRPEWYRQGIDTCILREGRPDPNIKNWRPEFRERVRKLKSYKNVYEVILVNEKGIITEGSQSNIFYIQHDRVITPRKENVLPGITRQYVIQLCKQEGFQIIEKDFGTAEIKKADAVFLTGTSPMVLPVRQLDDIILNTSNPLLTKIMEMYQKKVKDYINSMKQ